MNIVCTCGYHRFREERSTQLTPVGRWIQYDSEYSEGFGITPFGTYFGAGSAGGWGLFETTAKSTRLRLVCENCNRERSSRKLGGIAIFGSYIANNRVYLICSDPVLPISGYTLWAVDENNVTWSAVFQVDDSTALPMSADPPEITADAPEGPVADTLLSAPLPEVYETGVYTLELYDRTADIVTPLAVVTLEAPPMIHSPSTASILNAPGSWMNGGRVDPAGSPQFAASIASVPFDKCTVKVEYDARTGEFPSAQGWTRLGGGNASEWSLVSGGGLLLNSGGLQNYYQRIITLPAAIERFYVHARVACIEGFSGNINEGFEISGRFAMATDPYRGVRAILRNRGVYLTSLSGATESLISDWRMTQGLGVVGGAVHTSGIEDGYEYTRLFDRRLVPAVFGADGSAGASEVIVRMGAVTAGVSSITLLQTFTAADGRAPRAEFMDVAPVTAPWLSLKLMAESNNSVPKNARFLVRYGALDGNPNDLLPHAAVVNVNLASANTVYTQAVSLPELTRGEVFAFTIERDSTHIGDTLNATAHLLCATVASS